MLIKKRTYLGDLKSGLPMTFVFKSKQLIQTVLVLKQIAKKIWNLPHCINSNLEKYFFLLFNGCPTSKNCSNMVLHTFS